MCVCVGGGVTRQRVDASQMCIACAVGTAAQPVELTCCRHVHARAAGPLRNKPNQTHQIKTQIKTQIKSGAVAPTAMTVMT